MAIFNGTKNNTPINLNTLNIINAATTILGDLNSEGDMRIDGTVKGYISSKARLVLGNTCKVEGDIKAANLELSGEVNGNIYVSELLTIKVIIEAGATFNGKCSMREDKNTLKKITNEEQPTSQTIEPPTKQATL
jgi:cytoskeletal protein CcmA (bactofilin family)